MRIKLKTFVTNGYSKRIAYSSPLIGTTPSKGKSNPDKLDIPGSAISGSHTPGVVKGKINQPLPVARFLVAMQRVTEGSYLGR